MYRRTLTSLNWTNVLSLLRPRSRRAGRSGLAALCLSLHVLGFFAELAEIVLGRVIGHVAAVQARDLGDVDLVRCQCIEAIQEYANVPCCRWKR